MYPFWAQDQSWLQPAGMDCRGLGCLDSPDFASRSATIGLPDWSQLHYGSIGPIFAGFSGQPQSRPIQPGQKDADGFHCGLNQQHSRTEWHSTTAKTVPLDHLYSTLSLIPPQNAGKGLIQSLLIPPPPFGPPVCVNFCAHMSSQLHAVHHVSCLNYAPQI